METTTTWPGTCSLLCKDSEVQPGGRLSPNAGGVPGLGYRSSETK